VKGAATEVAGSRREEILAIAGRLFAQHGYHGTSIRHIASAADVQSATLYGHFSSKASMFRELAERYFADLLPELQAVAGSGSPATDRLAQIVRASIEVGLRHRPAFVALSNDWTAIQTTPHLSDLVAQRNKASRLWLGVIDDAVSEGSIDRGVDRGDVLWVLFAAVTGMVDDRYQAVDGSPAHPPVDLLLSVLSQGLWKPAAKARRPRPPRGHD